MPPPASLLDGSQVLQHSFDDATGTLRTTATATIIGGDMKVEISHTEDSIRLGDGTNFLTSTTIGGDVGLDVNLINTSIPVSQDGTWSVQIEDSAGNPLTSSAGSLDVNITNTVPISGTITANQGTTPWVISGTVNQGTSALPGDAWYMRITDGATTVGITGFSLNVDVTNAAGAAAVNIQDGGNSITVDGTIAATQSGTWVLGANSGVDIGDVTVNNGAGAAAVNIQDGGNSITVDGSLGRTWTLASGTDSVSANLTQISGSAYTLGQKTMVNSAPVVIASDQATISVSMASGNLTQVGGASLTLGQKTMTNSIPVVLSSDQSTVNVQATPATANIETYSTAIVGLAVAATATDIYTITGSATRTVKVRRIKISATRTADAKTDILLIKRSTANSGGTSTTQTIVPHDSTNAGGTAVVRAYTANPATLGTTVGTVRAQKQYIPVAASSQQESVVEWDFSLVADQPIILRGTSEVLAINLNRQTITGPSFDISIEFTEE